MEFTLSGYAGRRVELVGDFPDWKQPVAMHEVRQGAHRCVLALEPGIYRYRFMVDGTQYVSDPKPAAVDTAEGYDNALLIVNGTAPPLYFAPDRMHMVRTATGELRIHGEVEAGTQVPQHIWVRGSGGPTDRIAPDRICGLAQPGNIRMVDVVEGPVRSGRQAFTVCAQLDGDQEGSWGFVGVPQHTFALPDPSHWLAAPPSWLAGAVLYGVFVDRWWRAPDSPPDPRAVTAQTPSGPDTFYGGDLDGVTQDLDRLKTLGVDAVVLTPLNPSPTPHRYNATDLMTVDPLLGGDAALTRLVNAAHARGMKVVVDLSVTHVDENHPAFQDVLARQQDSLFAAWFAIKRFPVKRKDFRSYAFFYEHPELPVLDLSPQGAAAHAIEAAIRLVGLGVDGLRLDAMNDAPPGFWKDLRQAVRAVNPNVLLLGEVVNDRAALVSEERGVDCATDFQHREAMLAFFARGEIEANEFWSRVAFSEHRMGPFDAHFRLLFLDNHDTARFLSLADSVRRLHLALAYLYFRPEPVWLNYGTEAGVSCGKDLALKLDDAWPERLPMPRDVDAAAPLDGSWRTPGVMAALNEVRRMLHLAGPVQLVTTQGKLLAVERAVAGGVVIAMFNLSTTDAVDVEAPPGAEVLFELGGAHGPLPPLGVRVVKWLELSEAPALHLSQYVGVYQNQGNVLVQSLLSGDAVPMDGVTQALLEAVERKPSSVEALCAALAEHGPANVKRTIGVLRHLRLLLNTPDEDRPLLFPSDVGVLPVVDQIELTSHCPMTCLMCPRGRNALTRPEGFLSVELFERILGQLDPHKQFKPLTLHNLGESLLHPQLDQMLRLAAGAGFQPELSVNPGMLPLERYIQLADAGLRRLVFSVDGTDAGTLTQIRGKAARASRAFDHLEAVLEHRKAHPDHGPELVLQMIRLAPNRHQWDGFVQRYAHRKLPRVTAYLKDPDANTKDAEGTLMVDGARAFLCRAPWLSVVVLWDGRVVPCCYDEDAHNVLGDLNVQLLTDIWAGKPAQQLRAQLKNGQVQAGHICAQCAHRPDRFRRPSLQAMRSEPLHW